MSENHTNLTLKQRLRLQHADDANSASKPRSTRRYRNVLLSIGIVALLAGGVWAWLHFNPGTDPRVQQIADLSTEAGKLENPVGPEAQELYKQIHQKMKDLPDDLKKQAMENIRNSMKSRAGQFLAKSGKEQLAELDMIIAGIQLMQLKNSLTGQTPDKPGSDSNKRAGHGWGHGTDAQHVERVQSMLSTHSPQQRGQFWLGVQMFQARMKQQGVTPPSGGFF